MKYATCLLLSVSLMGIARSEVLDADFSPIQLKPTYRATVRLSETDITPFRRFSPKTFEEKREIAALKGVDQPAVLTAFNKLPLHGVIPSKAGHPGVLLIADRIYQVGDDIDAPSDESSTNATAKPLLAEHRVVLRSVTNQVIALSVVRLGEQAPTGPTIMEVSLLNFRTP